jgi:hypothetical protein
LHQSEEILQSGFGEWFSQAPITLSRISRIAFSMASPFSIFRKNQRVWMAGLVFVSVVAFVISPAIQSISDGARNAGSDGDAVVASWNGGSIRSKQMYREANELGLANQFLAKLSSQVIAKGGRPNVPNFNERAGQFGIATAQDLGHIIARKLFMTEAARRGIVFNNESVKKFLKEFCNGKLDGATVEKTFADATQRKLTWIDFNRLMCEELAFQQVDRIAQSGLQFEDVRESRTVNVASLTTPSKNWQDFLRFNQAAKIQAFPVFAKDFEASVKGKPSEREIQDLYNEGRDITRTLQTLATQPAFKVPKTAAFEYLVIDEESIIKEQMALVPEEALRAEYERRVAEKKFQVPVTPEATTPAVPPASDPTGAEMPETTSTVVPETPTPAEPAAPTEPAPADAAAPTEPAPASPTEPAPTEPAPTTTPETPSVPSDKPAETPPAPPEGDAPKTSRVKMESRSRIQLVSFQEGTPPTLENPIQEPAVPAADPTSTPESAAVGTPAPESPSTGSIELSDAPAAPVVAGDVPAQPETPMRTLAFEEVRDQIAREQTLEIARKIVEERIGMVMTPMSIYQSEFSNYRQMLQQKERGATEPKRPDLREIGAPLGFEVGSTGMLDADSSATSPLGSAFIFVAGGQNIARLGQLIEGSQGIAEIFAPNVAIGMASQRYVFWKTEETQPVPPTLESVRDQVVEVWTKQQAFKLAETRARELATKVGSSSLLDSLVTAEEKALVEEPGAFTWFNPMFARMQNRIIPSSVERLQPVDNTFMEAVFACQPGESTVAPDVNKTVYYVIKVTELTPDVSALFDKFASTPLEGVAAITTKENQQSIENWYGNLQKQLGFRTNN